jgi:hypothetical protein
MLNFSLKSLSIISIVFSISSFEITDETSFKPNLVESETKNEID